MPIHYLASLTASERTARANCHLGASLAFIAGALNAGGFLAIGQYTSHMTGMLSAAADNLVLGNIPLMAVAFLSILSFACGAASTAVMVNYLKRNTDRNVYTPPLLVEAALLLIFGLMGTNLHTHRLIHLSLTAMLLCYVMGLQNAVITKISNAEIRTTHVTGLVTDIGIELGKLFYWNKSHTEKSEHFVAADREKLVIHAIFLSMFFVGGVLGALGFKAFGFIAILPLAGALLFLALLPILDDILFYSHSIRDHEER